MNAKDEAIMWASILFNYPLERTRSAINVCFDTTDAIDTWIKEFEDELEFRIRHFGLPPIRVRYELLEDGVHRDYTYTVIGDTKFDERDF